MRRLGEHTPHRKRHEFARTSASDVPHHRRAEERDTLATVSTSAFTPTFSAASTEVQFFNNGNRFGELGVQWYREQFEGWSGEPFVGEATPGYMFWRHHPPVCVERIASVVPDVRLIALLRNPIDRAAFGGGAPHRARQAPQGCRSPRARPRTPPARDPLGIVTGGWYGASLEPFRQRFGDQLLVVLHDDVSSDPRGLYEQALLHIGAPPNFVPPELAHVRFSYRDRRGFDPDTKQPLTPQQRRELYEYFAADVAKLEQVLGRDLSQWEPGTLRAIVSAVAFTARGVRASLLLGREQPNSCQRPVADVTRTS